MGVLLALVALTFVTAEGIRPTQYAPKKIASRALIVRTQAVTGGASDSLDAEMLDDVPRIHPDAVGAVQLSPRGDGSFELSGTLADPNDGSAGTAAFLEVDGTRLATANTQYGAPPQPRNLKILIRPGSLQPGSHRLLVALISADQRGFFQLAAPIAVNVGR